MVYISCVYHEFSLPLFIVPAQVQIFATLCSEAQVLFLTAESSTTISTQNNGNIIIRFTLILDFK